MSARFDHLNYNVVTTEQERTELESAFATGYDTILVIQKAPVTTNNKGTIASAYFSPSTPPGAISQGFSQFFGQSSTRATLKEMVKNAGGRLVDPNSSCSRSQTIVDSASTTPVPTRDGTPVSTTEVRAAEQNEHIVDKLLQEPIRTNTDAAK